jgi:hypothetical protein
VGQAGDGQEKIKKVHIDNTYGELMIFSEIVLFYLQVDQNSMLVYIF